MMLSHKDVDTGEVDQEVDLEWNGLSGWMIILRIREFETIAGDVHKVEASAALQPDDCRALAANLLQMADRFERER